MSDEVADPQPLTDDEARRLGHERLLEIAAAGGSQTKHFRCQSCGNSNAVKVDMIDPDELVRVMKYLDDKAKAESADVSGAAALVLSDIESMSDEQLAEAFVLGE